MIDSFDFHSHHLKFNEVIDHKPIHKIEKVGKIRGIAVSISSFPLLHVEAYFENDKGEKFGYTNSGSCGCANQHIPLDMKCQTLNCKVWAHQMWPLPFFDDFHIKYTVFKEPALGS